MLRVRVKVPLNPRSRPRAAAACILYDAIAEAQGILADHLADRITPPDRAANVACARVFVALTSDELREAELFTRYRASQAVARGNR